jgi:hypothetical protein
LVFACTHPQSIVRFEEKMGENCDSKVQFWKKEIEENRSAVHLLQETMQGGSPPSLLGKQSQSGNIRFTVGQYWLIIKINGTNWEILSILWEICYLIGIFHNHSSPPVDNNFGKFF